MYFNTSSQIVSGANAAVSFTTDFTVNNFDNGSIQVIWSGVDGVAGTFRMQASINGTDFSNLTASPTTLTTSASSQLYNVTDAGYSVWRAVYAAGGNTTGSIDVWTGKKSRR